MNRDDLLTLPVDIYQRHSAAAHIAERARAHLRKSHLQVLDVGGLGRAPQGAAILPLARFLPEDDVLAIDLKGESVPGYVMASGLHIPFNNRAFDLVVSCDTLEHIPLAWRDAFVNELLRVSSHFAVVIAPFDGDLNRRAECALHEYLTAQGIHSPPLQEHREHGLPSLTNLKALLTKRQLPAVDLPDGYLPHWLTMILLNHTQDQSLDLALDLNRYYNRYFSPGDRREPAYRRVVVVAQPGDEGMLSGLSAAFCEPAAAAPDLGFAGDLAEILGRLRMATAETRARLDALEAENAWLRRSVDGYERGRFIRFMRRVQAWKKKAGAT
jgi:hypothetical protein